MKMKFKGELIRTLANRNEITLTKLAKMIGVSRFALYTWIDEKSIPPSDKFMKIVEIFKENPHDFFE